MSQFLGYATFGDLKGRSFTVDSVVYPLQLIGNDLIISEQAIMTAEPNPMPTLTERVDPLEFDDRSGSDSCFGHAV